MVTTLPLSSRVPNNWALLTPHIAYNYAKVNEREFVMLLNTRGIRYTPLGNSDLQLTLYSGHLDEFQIKPSFITTDRDPNFTLFFNEMIRSMIRRKEIFQKSYNISFCKCGRVEVPTIFLNKALTEERSKVFTFSSSGKVLCNFCKSIISNKQQKVYVFQDKKDDQIPVFYPSFYLKEFNHLDLSQPQIVSRHFRNPEIEVDGTGYDMDFFWKFYLPFLLTETKNETKATIVCGSSTRYQAYRTALMWPNIVDRIIVHPMVLAPSPESEDYLKFRNWNLQKNIFPDLQRRGEGKNFFESYVK